MRGKSLSGHDVSFGEFGLKATTCGWLTAAQLESARKTIAHHTQRGGKIWCRVFPDKPVTGKAAGTRMGSGKGDIARFVAVIRPGQMLFEVAGVSRELAIEAFRKASAKVPFVTKTIEK